MSLIEEAEREGVKILVDLVMDIWDKHDSREDALFEAEIEAHRFLMRHGADLALAAKRAAERKLSESKPVSR